MPSKTYRHSRLSIPIPDEVRARFQANADRAGVTLSKFVSSWLVATVDGTDWLAEQVQLANQAPAALAAKMGRMANRLAHVDTPDKLLGLLEAALPEEGAPQRAARSAPKPEAAAVMAFPAPSSNTGLNKSGDRKKDAGKSSGGRK